MNTDLSEIVVFLSDGLSRMNSCFIRSGFSDKGEDFMENNRFEKMMQEGMDFLCADSHLSLDARKAAWNFQTNKIISYLERSFSHPQSKEVLLKMMSKISDKNFISQCTNRAELIEKVMQKALQKEVTNESSVGKGRSM